MRNGAAFALVVLVAAGSVSAQNEVPGGFNRAQFEGYKPTDAVLSRMSFEGALDVLREIAGIRPKSPEVRKAAGLARLAFFVEQRELSAFRPVGEVRKVEIFEDRIELEINRADRGPGVYYFHALPEALEIVHDYIFFDHYGIPLDRQWYLWCTDGGQFEDNRAGCAKLLADALYVLRKARQGMPTEEEAFRAAAAKYREAGRALQLPEDVRRFRVQAEFLIEQRRYADAIRVYDEALKVAPWWADGRFNRALVLAEAGRYREAILEMNRFLVLEPEAPHARAGRDSIYRWEATMGTAKPAR